MNIQGIANTRRPHITLKNKIENKYIVDITVPEGSSTMIIIEKEFED